MRLFGIPIKVEGSFFVLALFLASGRLSEPVFLVEWLLVVVVSVLLHEFGHALAGRAFGLAPEITLYSMGGLTSWRGGVPLTAPKEVAVSLAGPLAGFLFGGVVYLARPLLMTADVPPVAQAAFFDLMWVNVGWGLFNLLPILPLDGGHALLAVERGALKRREQLITPAVSLLVAVAVAAWAFSGRHLWIAFLGCWFGYSNGHALYMRLQSRRDRKLQAPLEEALSAFNARDFGASAALAREVLARARTDEPKRQALRTLVFSLAYLEDADGAERELRRYQVFYGEDPYLEGFVRLTIGPLEEAAKHLRAAFESSPTKETGLALYDALWRTGQFAEALELCAHPALADARRSLRVNLQSEAFHGGAFDVSARAGAAAFEERAEAPVAFNLACAYGRLGDVEAGLVWLGRALAEGFDDREAFESDDDLDPLRGHPGFEELRRKLPAADASRE